MGSRVLRKAVITRRSRSDIANSEPGGLVAIGSPDRPQVIAVCSAHGSVGRSTVAAGLAASLGLLAGKRAGPRLLIDLDTVAPSQAIMHGREVVTAGVLGSARLIRQERFTDGEHERLTVRLPDYDLLTGIASIERWPELDDYSIGLMLHEMSGRYEQIVLDLSGNVLAAEVDAELGAARNIATTKALQLADHIVLLTAADAVSLARTLEVLTRIQQTTESNLTVVVNRSRNSAIGNSATRQILDLLAEAGVASSDVAFLPDDGDNCDRALLEGRSVVAVKPRGQLARALRELSARLNSSHVHSSRVGQAEWQG